MRRPVARAICSMPAKFGPTSVPSRTTSVYWIRSTPHPLTWVPRSRASTVVISFQPATATLPFLASMATATASGQSRIASCTTPGRATAAVPKMTRSAPCSRYRIAFSSTRRPPPTSTGSSPRR